MGNGILIPPGVHVKPPAGVEPDRFVITIDRATDGIGWNVKIAAEHKGRIMSVSPTQFAVGWGAAIDRAHAELEQLRTSFT